MSYQALQNQPNLLPSFRYGSGTTIATGPTTIPFNPPFPTGVVPIVLVQVVGGADVCPVYPQVSNTAFQLELPLLSTQALQIEAFNYIAISNEAS